MKKESMPLIIIPDNIPTVHVLAQDKLVIRNAANIKNELLTALAGSQNLVIVLKEIIKIDLTVIQLLIGLQNSAAGQGKSVSFCCEKTEYIRPLLEYSGFGQVLNEHFKNAA